MTSGPLPSVAALQSRQHTAAPPYVLVSAARNEAAFLASAIEAVAAQTHRPARWVIVDDRSTDGTADVVRRYLAECEFIRLLIMPGDGATNFGKKAAAFNAGLELLRDIDYSYIGNLDADITVPPSYYETLLREFERDPVLGIAGGAVYSRNGKDFVPINAAADSVPGAVQLFRKSCFADVGGRYLLLERGGIDAAAEIMARMRGWSVRQYPDIRVQERRRTGTSSGWAVLAKYREGLRFHSLGYATLFYVVRAVYKLGERPFVIGSVAALAGFLAARFLRHPISLPHEVVLFLRAEQKQKLRCWTQKARHGDVVPEANSYNAGAVAMDLSVIIVNWNSAGYLQRCLGSLYASTSDIEYEVIVVDNASYDGCGEMLRTEFPQVRFIQNDQNRGFAAANNLAVTCSSGRFLLFLNPDTEVLGRAIAKMLSVFEQHPLAGIVGCKLLNADSTIQTSCVQSFPTLWNEALDAECLRRAFPKSRLWGNAALYTKEPGVFKVEAISGACLMIRRDVFEEVGRFTTQYFMYVEDRDLCYKASRAGYPAYFINTAEVIHYGGMSSDVRSESNFAIVMRCESLFKFMHYRRGRIYGVAYRAAMTMSACFRLLALWIAARASGAASTGKWRGVLRWACGLGTGVRSDWES